MGESQDSFRNLYRRNTESEKEMKTFKTPKGTELPLLDLRGKDYLQVAHRIVWFREERPLWRIQTEIHFTNDTQSIVRATILDEHGNIMAQGTKSETAKGFADHLEKSETGSIGRALALCGFGTQFAPEFDEGERLADSPLPRHEPQPRQASVKAPGFVNTPFVSKHTDKQDTSGYGTFAVTFGKYENKMLRDVHEKDLEEYERYIRDKAIKDGKPLVGKGKELMDAIEIYLKGLK